MKQKSILSLKTLTKSSVWEIQENDVFRLWEAAERDADLKDNTRHYMDIIRSAFEMEEIKVDKPEVIKKYEDRGFKIGNFRADENAKQKWAIKKRVIMRVSDLTRENIRHISAAKLLEIIDRNFGGGWESLSQNIKDIIESGFDISTTTLPKDRLHKKGGMYEKRTVDGFEVLEIPKGAWVEAIFAKVKSNTEKTKIEASTNSIIEQEMELNMEQEDNLPEIGVVNDSKETDSYDENDFTEESYRTTFDSDSEELNIEDEDVSSEDEDY